MKTANYIHITAELSTCGCNINMSPHARLRAIERSSLAPSRVLELVARRHAVLLPFRAANRSYHLLYDRKKMDFIVAVVAIDGCSGSNSASVVTVLTREQFENDAGPIAKQSLRTAASRALDAVDFRRWEEREYGPTGVRRRYRVFTYYKKQDGSTGC
ncbi:hypothetical protein [Paraburkholderia sp. MM5482-R1]|uniref:hypothetical protein n=1 Tax=unclassified Paraburkholderia TaxID=2615204 RepID=UPI003D1E9CFA